MVSVRLVDCVLNNIEVYLVAFRVNQVKILVCNNEVMVVSCSTFDLRFVLAVEPTLVDTHCRLAFDHFFSFVFIKIKFVILITTASSIEFK